MNKVRLILLIVLLASRALSQTCDETAIHANETSNAVCFDTVSNVLHCYSNNYPDHSDSYDSPFTVAASDESYSMCAYPDTASGFTQLYEETETSVGCTYTYAFGVCINGVKFDPSSAEFFENTATGENNIEWHKEARYMFAGAFGNNGGHLNPFGEYHYHDVPADYFTDDLSIDGSSHSPIVGYAADGFPIYYKYVYSDPEDASSSITELSSGYSLKSGTRPGDGVSAPDGSYSGLYYEDYEYATSTLDECNGRWGVTPDHPYGTYYYVLTDNYPYIPRCFKGTFVDNSFRVGPDASCPSSTASTDCSEPVYGCMDPFSNNYNASATVDDGSCTYNSTSQNTGEPIIDDWMLNEDGTTASYYQNTGSTTSPNFVYTTSSTLANVNSICYTEDTVWIEAEGMTTDMGQFLNPGQPLGMGYVWMFPRNPQAGSGTEPTADEDAIGVLINGIPMYARGDGTSWDGGSQDNSPMGQGVWTGNAYYSEGYTLDTAFAAHPQQDGAYHSHATPFRLYNDPSTEHSPIVGFANDGFPVYGPFGYSDSLDNSSAITRILPSYQLRSITQRHSLSDGTVLQPQEYGPDVSATHPLGEYVEDYEYVAGLGHLDEHNGRWCVTPEYPDGIYAYFVATDSNGDPAYPYYLGDTYYGTPVLENNASMTSGVTTPSGTSCDMLCDLGVSLSRHDVSTNGGNDGYIIATVSGDLGNITYTWSNGGSGAAINNLTAGVYSLTVTDDIEEGCTVEKTVTITEPSSVSCTLSIAATSNETSGSGSSDGDAAVSVSGSQGTLSYMWSTGSQNAAIVNVPAGTYSVTVSDDILAGCSAITTVTVEDAATISCTLSVSMTSNDASEFGASDGDATAIVSGGQNNITYSWSNGGATAAIVNLTAGTYNVTLTDDVTAGCSVTGVVTVDEPAAVSCTVAISVSSHNVTANGGSNGDATAVVSGGQGTITYSWSNSKTTKSINNLVAGVYDVTVTDNITTGCVATASVTITEPDAVSCTLGVTIISSSVTTNGGSDGSAEAISTGLQGNASYIWSNAATTKINSNLVAGIYSVTVSDDIASNCEATASVTVTEPELECDLSINVSVSHATSNGASDGSAQVIPSGNQGMLSFVWSTGSNDPVITGLPTGTYSVTATDNIVANCTATGSVFVTEPAITPTCNLTVTPMFTDASVYGANDGMASVMIEGSQGNVAINWSNSVTTPVNDDLIAGVYDVTVTDDIVPMCGFMGSITISEPSAVCGISVVASGTNVSVNGASDGELEAVVTGGQGTITYIWSNMETTAMVSGVAAGTYTVTVTDDITGGCTATSSVTIHEPAAITCTIGVETDYTDASIPAATDGTASAYPTGLQGNVMYMWSHMGATTGTITGLGMGVYDVTVVDDIDGGCTAVASVTVSEPEPPTCTLGIAITSMNPTMPGGSDGSVDVMGTGAPQASISYMWSMGATTQLVTGLPEGVYSITATNGDIPNCTVTDAVTLTAPEPECNIAVYTDQRNVTMPGGSDGSAGAIATGAPQMNIAYTWSHGETTGIVTGLSAGTYYVTVEDVMIAGCSESAMVIITEPEPLSCDIFAAMSKTNVSVNGGSDGSASVVAVGNIGNVSYMWSNASTTSSIAGLSVGVYTVTVSDDGIPGCSAEGMVTITEPAAVTLTCSLAVSATGTNVTINGGNDGTAMVTIAGDQGNISYMWSNSSVTSSISGLVAGVYTVTVTDDIVGSCSETASVTISQPTGINELSMLDFKVYPNPNTGSFVINTYTSDQYNLKINNVVGQVVYQDSFYGDKIELNIEHVEAGIYFVEVQNGNARQIQRIIINK